MRGAACSSDSAHSLIVSSSTGCKPIEQGVSAHSDHAFAGYHSRLRPRSPH